MPKLNKQGKLFAVKATLPFKKQNKGYEIPLIWDTGAGTTIVDTKVIDYLGYSAREDGFQKSSLDGAVGTSKGFLIRIPKFECLGFEIPNFVIACHDMQSNLGVTGLLGMNFLENFRVDMNYRAGEIFTMEWLNI